MATTKDGTSLTESSPGDIVARLLDELNELKAQVAALAAENNNLREAINKPGNSGSSSSPGRRKKAKIYKQDVPTVSASDGCDDVNTASDPNFDVFIPVGGANANANSFTVVSGRKKNSNRKKIIQAIDTDLYAVRKSIKAANCKHFTLKQSNVNAPVKISVEQSDEVSSVRSALKGANISFHEYKLESEKNKCYVLRGLEGTTNDAVAESTKINAGIPAESSLSVHTTCYMRANPSSGHSSLLKLVVPPTFDEQVFRSIKYIDHVAVSFEKLHVKSVVQCKNCQRFGHSAGGCQHNHRCVKCGENHLRDVCLRTHNKSVKLICCNCGGDHSANNLAACSYFKQNYAKSPTPSGSAATMLSAPTTSSNARPAGAAAGSVRTHAASYAAAAARATTNGSECITSLLLRLMSLLYPVFPEEFYLTNI